MAAKNGKAKRKHEQSMELERIEPKLAEKYLDTMDANRPFSASNRAKFERLLRRGAFKVTGDAIKFDWNGHLIDGQHRLRAIVSSGVAAECWVARGLDPDVFPFLDDGKRRGLHDNLAVLGEKNYVQLATAIRVSYYLRQKRSDEQFFTLKGHTTLGDALTHDVAVEWLDKNPGIRRSLRLAYANDCGLVLSVGYGAALHYCCARATSVARASEFWLPVFHGEELRRGTPEYELRKRYLANQQSRDVKLSREALVAYGVKAWNAWIAGEECSDFHLSNEDRRAVIARS